jgi:hypothetical protein
MEIINKMARRQKQYKPFKGSRKKNKTINDRDEYRGAQGLEGTEVSEDVPSYNMSSTERVFSGPNNAWIVLGRDRNASKKSGQGGAGSTAAGAIDIVVGRGSNYKKGLFGKEGPPDKTVLLDPNFFGDAARVYITQKGDVDQYFGLAKGSESTKSRNRSAIGIKADHVRIIGRNHIKIVTGKAQMEGGGRKGEKNAASGDIEKTGRIDLIAGNYTEDEKLGLMGFVGSIFGAERVKKLQPIPKGDNLRECLEELVDQMQDIMKRVLSNSYGITKITGIVGAHTHEVVVPLPSGQIVAMPSPSLAGVCGGFIGKMATEIAENYQIKYNLGVTKVNYLEKISPRYINSRHVNTT